MPLKVEYAASGRATCSLRECGKRITKDELRIGTLIVLPFGDGAESWKWRHLCCFTARQLSNAGASHELDSIAGYDELAESDKQLVDAMRRGELIGKTDMIGRAGDVAHSRVVRATATRPGARKSTQKRARGSSVANDNANSQVSRAVTHDDTLRTVPATHNATADDVPVDSDATDECDVVVKTVADRPRCPLGQACYRTNTEHFTQYTHDDSSSLDSAGETDTVRRARRRPFIKSRRVRRVQEEGLGA